MSDHLTPTEAGSAALTSRVIAEDLVDMAHRTWPVARRLAGSTMLVTGAAGFLPSYLVDLVAYLNTRLDEPCRVVCVDNLSTGSGRRLNHLQADENIAFVTADASQGLEIDEAVDWVIHGASIASPTWYRRYPLETIAVNVEGTRHALDLAHRTRARGFVLLSSSEIYGDPPPDRIPTPETYWGNVSATGPRACYDESKRLAETLAFTYHRLYSTPVKVIRPFNVYGPRLRLDDGRVIPDFLRSVLAAEPITLYSNGATTRSFCYLADFVVAMVHLLVDDVAGEAFNVGTDEEVTITAAAQVMDEIGGTGAGIRYETSPDPHYLTDNPSRRCPDLTKTKGAIDWEPVFDLRAGLSRTLRSLREEQSQ